MQISSTHISLSQDEIHDAIMIYLNNAGIQTSNQIDIIGILPRSISVTLVRDDRMYLQQPLDLRAGKKF